MITKSEFPKHFHLISFPCLLVDYLQLGSSKHTPKTCRTACQWITVKSVALINEESLASLVLWIFNLKCHCVGLNLTSLVSKRGPLTHQCRHRRRPPSTYTRTLKTMIFIIRLHRLNSNLSCKCKFYNTLSVRIAANTISTCFTMKFWKRGSMFYIFVFGLLRHRNGGAHDMKVLSWH